MIHNKHTVHNMTHTKQNPAAGPIVMYITYNTKEREFLRLLIWEMLC